MTNFYYDQILAKPPSLGKLLSLRQEVKDMIDTNNIGERYREIRGLEASWGITIDEAIAKSNKGVIYSTQNVWTATYEPNQMPPF